MEKKQAGYHGVMLEIDLSTGKVEKRSIPADDLKNFVGGRGLGIKMLWDRLKTGGVDPHSAENPLMFLPGPFSGFPAPCSSRTCVVTKSPHTSPVESEYLHASTVSYSNMGGFIGPEIRFAGYDGIVITGKAASPAYIVINDGRVEIRDARKFWGMGTDAFDKAFIKELGDRRFRTCYVGPAGEHLVEYACIINTAARTAGRGGTGCVMGSKNLKAIAIKGSQQPDVADRKRFLTLLEEARNEFKVNPATERWRKYGTAEYLALASDMGMMTVRNYREGTFPDVGNIRAEAALQKVWIRNSACYCCPLACKKSGLTTTRGNLHPVHDGPEYETGTMLGANLMILDLGGMLRAIYHADDYGLDIISLGNVIGFLMEAYEKGFVDHTFLDGIDLKWGSVEATLQMIERIAHRDGIGDLAARGVKALSKKIGQDSEKFAVHVKGNELAGWNIHANPPQGICYVTANRGGCHLNGNNPEEQDGIAMMDSTGLCLFSVSDESSFLGAGRYAHELMPQLLAAITGIARTHEEYMALGERVFNLEKLFNLREGFTRADDILPDRFFEEPLTVGPQTGAVVNRDTFNTMLETYYARRGWDPKTTRPTDAKLKSLGLPT